MAETKFTPGPWAIDWNDRCIVREGVADICHMDPCASSHDAHLVAAAPEMYAELDRAAKWLSTQSGDVPRFYVDVIHALLSKARGEQTNTEN